MALTKISCPLPSFYGIRSPLLVGRISHFNTIIYLSQNEPIFKWIKYYRRYFPLLFFNHIAYIILIASRAFRLNGSKAFMQTSFLQNNEQENVYDKIEAQ